MGYYIYPPAPGTEHGPCVEPCQHTDCATMRRDALRTCRICKLPIGYDRAIHFESTELYGDEVAIVHHACLAAEVEQERKMRAATQGTDLEARLNSGQRTIDRSEIQEAVDLVLAGKVQPQEGIDYKRMPPPEPKPIKITPALIAAERKPTRKAALIYIRYGADPESELESKAWDLIQDLVPYWAIEVFFDRVKAMARIYTA